MYLTRLSSPTAIFTALTSPTAMSRSTFGGRWRFGYGALSIFIDEYSWKWRCKPPGMEVVPGVAEVSKDQKAAEWRPKWRECLDGPAMASNAGGNLLENWTPLEPPSSPKNTSLGRSRLLFRLSLSYPLGGWSSTNRLFCCCRFNTTSRNSSSNWCCRRIKSSKAGTESLLKRLCWRCYPPAINIINNVD